MKPTDWLYAIQSVISAGYGVILGYILYRFLEVLDVHKPY